MDVAAAGKPIPDVVWLASAGPFFLSSVIADSKFATATVFLETFQEWRIKVRPVSLPALPIVTKQFCTEIFFWSRSLIAL